MKEPKEQIRLPLSAEVERPAQAPKPKRGPKASVSSQTPISKTRRAPLRKRGAGSELDRDSETEPETGFGPESSVESGLGRGRNQAPAWGTRARPASVEQLVVAANRCLEVQFPALWVQGEISTLRQPASGHIYFTLKDDRAAIPVAMWRSSVRRLKLPLKEGMAVNVRGRLGIYSAQGKFQLYAESIEPTGQGERMAALERLKARLQEEGLFDPERKKALPKWPKTVAVITSATGAAVRDICTVISRRCPTSILIIPAVVQGDEAVPTLLQALKQAQKQKDVDVIIMGRGGGAVEDLWCFNDEKLVRAVADCKVPVVSAVGHEIDTTLIDFVADQRAATPSQAGEFVVPEYDVVAHRLGIVQRRLVMALQRRVIDRAHDLNRVQQALARQGRGLVAQERERVHALQNRLSRVATRWSPQRRERLQVFERRLLALDPRRKMAADHQALVALEHRLAVIMRARLVRVNGRFSRAAAKLDMLSPLQVLGRGYAIALDEQGQAVRDARQLCIDQSLEIRLAKGRATAQVKSLQADSPTAVKGPRGKKTAKKANKNPKNSEG